MRRIGSNWKHFFIGKLLIVFSVDKLMARTRLCQMDRFFFPDKFIGFLGISSVQNGASLEVAKWAGWIQFEPNWIPSKRLTAIPNKHPDPSD
ncbi:hypothetical protein LguiA_018925 [Lonicera macranthoides]